MLREAEAAAAAAAVHSANECGKDREGEVGGGAAPEDTWSVEVKAMLDENAPLVGSLRVVSKPAPAQGGGEGGGDGREDGGGGGGGGGVDATVLFDVVPADGSEAFRVEMMCSGGGFCFRRMENGGGGEGQTYDTMSSLLLNVWYVAACVRTRVVGGVSWCVPWCVGVPSYTHAHSHTSHVIPLLSVRSHPLHPLPTRSHPFPSHRPFHSPSHNHPSHTAHLHRSVSTRGFLPGLQRSRTAPSRKARVAPAAVAAVVTMTKAKMVVGKASSAVQPPKASKASGIRPGKAKVMQPPPLRLLWRIGSQS